MVQQEYTAGQLPSHWHQIVKAALKTNPLKSGSVPTLPQAILSCNQVAIDQRLVERFHHFAGWDGPSLHPCVPHLMAFGLQMQLLTDKQMPIPMLGLVHLQNRIEQYQPIAIDQPLSFKVWVENLQEHSRGWLYDLRTTAEQGGEKVWQQCSSNLFRTRPVSNKVLNRKSKRVIGLLQSSQNFKFDRDTGRRYASISKDYNPIHLYPITARFLGFSKPIAHGMYSKARAIGALEAQLGERFAIETQFKMPVFLPSTLHFSYEVEEVNGGRFILLNQDMTKLHMQGSWTALDEEA